MPVTYVNRRGDTYYLLQSVTKTGKPKYYASKKQGENTAEAIPEGFEFYENPVDGIVQFRKVRPTKILPTEQATAMKIIREVTHREIFFAECEGDSLVIYWPDRDPVAVTSMMSGMFGIPADLTSAVGSLLGARVDKTVLMFLRTSPVLRFILSDAFAPHLGNESMFEIL